MELRPVEQVLLQTLDDLDPKRADRLRKELYEPPKAMERTFRKAVAIWEDARAILELVLLAALSAAQLIASTLASLLHRL